MTICKLCAQLTRALNPFFLFDLRKFLSLLFCLLLFFSFIPLTVNANGDKKQTIQKGDFLNYNLLFRTQKLINGTTIEAPVDLTGTINGTLSFYVEDILAPTQANVRLSVDIPNYYNAERMIIFDTNSQQVFSSNRSYIGFFNLWINEINLNDIFVISQNVIINKSAIASYEQSTIIDTRSSFSFQEVYMLRVNSTVNNHTYSWNSFYDKDTFLLIRMIGDVADPILLGLLGVEIIDFAVSIRNTSLDLGLSPQKSPLLMLFNPTLWLIITLLVIFIVGSVIIHKKQSVSKKIRKSR